MKSRTLYWIESKKFIPQSFTPISISFRSFWKKLKRRRSSHRAKSPLQINPSNAFQKKEEEEEEIYDLDYLERPLDDGCSYSRRKHEHSETWSPVCASWSAYFRREYRSHCPSPCPLCPSPWRPREASPPTFAPCWRIQGRRSRPTSSSGVENYPTSFEQFLPRFPLRKPFRPTPSFARKNLPVSVSLPLLLSPMYSLYFLKRKKKKSTTNSSPPPWEFLLSIHFQFIVSLLLLLLLEVNTWSSFLWFTFSSLLETRFERRFVEKLSGGTISSAGGFLIVPRVRVEEVEEGGVSASILAPLPRFRRGSIKSFDTVGTRWTIRGKVASTTGESSNSVKKQHVARSQSWIVATLSFASDFERDLDYLKDNTIYNKTNKFFF